MKPNVGHVQEECVKFSYEICKEAVEKEII
jgi:hypothetical protein